MSANEPVIKVEPPKKIAKKSKKPSKKAAIESESSESNRASVETNNGAEAANFLHNVVQQCSKFFLGLHEYCNKYAADLAKDSPLPLKETEASDKNPKNDDKNPSISKDAKRKSQTKSEKKVKKELDPAIAAQLPKKPLAPYFIYLAERRAEVAAQRKDLSSTEVVELVAKEWRKLEKDTKDEYVNRFKALHKEYNSLKERLENRGSSIELEVNIPAGNLKPSTDKDLSTKDESKLGFKSAALSEDEEPNRVKIEPFEKSIIQPEPAAPLPPANNQPAEPRNQLERVSESTVTITSDPGAPAEVERGTDDIEEDSSEEDAEDSEGVEAEMEETGQLGKRQAHKEGLDPKVLETQPNQAAIPVDSSEEPALQVKQPKAE